MKKLLIPICLLALGALSCGKNAFTINKSIDYTYETDIPNVNNPGVPFPAQGISLSFPKYAFATNSNSFFDNNGTGRDKLISFRAGKLGVTLLRPVNGYLNYVDTLRVYVSGENLPEVLAAHKYGVSTGAKTLDLTCEDVELKDYFLKDSMYYRVETHFTGYPDSNSTVQINTTFSVTANPSN